jgi:hypothetical protein
VVVSQPLHRTLFWLSLLCLLLAVWWAAVHFEHLPSSSGFRLDAALAGQTPELYKKANMQRWMHGIGWAFLPVYFTLLAQLLLVWPRAGAFYFQVNGRDLSSAGWLSFYCGLGGWLLAGMMIWLLPILYIPEPPGALWLQTPLTATSVLLPLGLFGVGLALVLRHLGWAANAHSSAAILEEMRNAQGLGVKPGA